MEDRNARVNVANDDAQADLQMPFVAGGDVDIQRVDGVTYVVGTGDNFVNHDIAQARQMHREVRRIGVRQEIEFADAKLERLKVASAFPACVAIDSTRLCLQQANPDESIKQTEMNNFFATEDRDRPFCRIDHASRVRVRNPGIHQTGQAEIGGVRLIGTTGAADFSIWQWAKPNGGQFAYTKSGGKT